MRNDSVDLMKGIGILFVVCGHAVTPPLLHTYIYSFHMPLFVFIGGMFAKKMISSDLVISKAKRLLVPFFFYSLLSWIIYLLIVCTLDPALIKAQIGKLVYIAAGTGQNGVYHNGNVALWFLPFLFVEYCIYWVTSYFARRRLFIILGVTILGLILSHYDVKLPANIDVAFALYPFFYLGTLYIKNMLPFLSRLNNWQMFIIIISAILLHTMCFIYNGNIDVVSAIYGDNVLLFYFTSICAIIYFVAICFFINKISFINYFGRNSLVVLVVHILLLQLFQLIIPFRGEYPLVYGIVETGCVLGICMFIIRFVNKYLPWSIGKNTRNTL